MIHLMQVSKSYLSGEPVLSNVELHIPRGSFICLTGRSGAGKTTLLKMLFAEEFPSAGDVVVGGRETGLMRSKEIPFFRRQLGVVFQDFKLLPRRTVYENIALTLEICGCPQWQMKKRVEAVAEEVGLSHCLHKRPAYLSGGERQRVAIARAIVHEPWLLLADEPTGNLDPQIADEIIELFKRAHRRGTTVLLATHDRVIIQQLKSYASRTLHLEAGQIVDVGAELDLTRGGSPGKDH